MKQNSCDCSFTTKESWVILSPIEQSIKKKIESAGVPLKDWDISINYGIKTGFNDAFIISGEKREEILNNCKTKEDLKMVFNSFIDDHIDFDNNNENEVLKSIEDTFRKTMDKLYKEDRKHKIELVKQAQKNREKER